jgi:hypothetical protein
MGWGDSEIVEKDSHVVGELEGGVPLGGLERASMSPLIWSEDVPVAWKPRSDGPDLVGGVAETVKEQE